MFPHPSVGPWSGFQGSWAGAGLPQNQAMVFQRCQPKEFLPGCFEVADRTPQEDQSPRLGRLWDRWQLQEPAKDLDHIGPQPPLPALGEVCEEGEAFQLTPFEKCLRGDREGAQNRCPLDVIGDVKMGSHSCRCRWYCLFPCQTTKLLYMPPCSVLHKLLLSEWRLSAALL